MDAASADQLLGVAEDARAVMRRGEDDAAVAQIEARYVDLRAALRWYFEEGRTAEADRLASALVPFWMATKRIDDGSAWYADALPDADPPEASRARALYDHGYLVFWSGQYELARRRFDQARELADATGDRNLIALALAGSARVSLNTDPAAAVRQLRTALEVTRDIPESDGRSSAEHVLGVALQMAGDLEGARAVMVERLQRARDAGNDFGTFVEASNLGMVERQLGNLDRAEELSREALRIVTGMHDEMAIPWVVNGLAAVTAAKGHAERAATLVGAAESMLERAGGEWPPDEREQYEETLRVLAASLDPTELARCRAVGREMALDDAVAFALSNG